MRAPYAGRERHLPRWRERNLRPRTNRKGYVRKGLGWMQDEPAVVVVMMDVKRRSSAREAKPKDLGPSAEAIRLDHQASEAERLRAFAAQFTVVGQMDWLAAE